MYIFVQDPNMWEALRMIALFLSVLVFCSTGAIWLDEGMYKNLHKGVWRDETPFGYTIVAFGILSIVLWAVGYITNNLPVTGTLYHTEITDVRQFELSDIPYDEVVSIHTSDTDVVYMDGVSITLTDEQVEQTRLNKNTKRKALMDYSQTRQSKIVLDEEFK